MSSNAKLAAATGLPDDKTFAQATGRDRIEQFCGWFELDLPKLRYRKDYPVMNDALRDWLDESGASLDWIWAGDAKCMAAAYRRAHQNKKEFQEALVALNFAMRLTINHELNFDDALAAFKAAVVERRAEKRDGEAPLEVI